MSWRIGVVAIGGAIGASARWLLSNVVQHGTADWPWSTLIANLVGCLAIGLAARRLQRDTLQWDGVVTGLLGGFTTMSALAVELNDFVDADRTGLAVAYAAVTVVGGVVATLIAGSAESQ